MTVALACLLPVAQGAGTAVFGSIVPVGGSASDIALDESRQLLYVADFGAHAIDVMSTVDDTIHSSFNVLPFPGAIAMSFDSQYLVVAHYCSVTLPPGNTSPPCTNAITSIHLADRSQRVFSLADAPLGVSFLADGRALVVTRSQLLFFTPSSGQLTLLDTFTNISKSLPVPFATFPGQVLQASLATSADGKTIWGVASAGTPIQFVFRYQTASGLLPIGFTTTPLLLPRVSSAADGSYAMIGYSLIAPGGPIGLYLKGRYPNIISSTNITGVAVDSVHGTIYAQLPDTNQSTGPSLLSAAARKVPAMLIMDSDNLTFRDRINLPEDMVGRAVLNAAGTVLYAISESGVMVLPVGSLPASHRISTAQEDLPITTNFCNTALLSQTLTINDPGGNNTDFTVTATQAGVTVSPASGTTPATVTVHVDPSVIPANGGTTAINLAIASNSAVNQPRPVRLLINKPDPSQRGAITDQPGILSDILPDPGRNRIYVLRQDLNQLLVFDGASLSPITTLRTATSPTTMAITRDQKFLLVGHNDSELVTSYDLNALQAASPIVLPPGHFGRSIAAANAATLVLARDEGNSPIDGTIDSIDLTTFTAANLPTLGIFANHFGDSLTGVLSASPSGGDVLLALPNGTVALYTSTANTFVNSRQDLTSLSGAYSASDYDTYVAGNFVFNPSLVPIGIVNPSPLPSSGFTFTGQGGFMASAASASASGTLQRFSSVQDPAGTSALTIEAPVLPNSSGTLPGPSQYGPYGAGSASNYAATSFMRTVAPLPSGAVVVLTTSGLTFLPANYDTSAAPPVISAVVNAANGFPAVAPGGLISIYGQNFNGATFAANSLPLTTTFGNSCIGVNGIPIPLLYVSSQQVNAQLPFNVVGNATLLIHTPGGLSSAFNFSVSPTAPAIFLSGAAGTQTGLATVVRDDNNQLITPTNPIHLQDRITIYLTGMGQTTTQVSAGQAAPSNPLAHVSVPATVTLGGTNLPVSFAGLAPGEVGVYQIDALIPFKGIPSGLAIPLSVAQGGMATTVYVRVVN